MKEFFGVSLVLGLAGCAPAIPVLIVSPAPEAAQQARPASQVMNELAVSPRDGTGAVVVTSQDRSWPAAGCTVDVALDDELVAGLRPGEQVVLFAEPGRRTVSLSVRDEEACSPASAEVPLFIVEHTTQKIDVASDSHHALKVEVDTYGRSLPP